MLPISSKDTIRFTPPGYAGEADAAPVYLIGVPTMAGRARFNAAMTAEGCNAPSDAVMIDMLRDGIREVLDPEIQSGMIEIVDAFEAERKGDLPIDDTLRRDFQEIERVMHKHYPPYAGLMADKEYYVQMLPILATKYFLCGWENVAHPFERRGGIATDTTLQHLGDAEVRAIGWEVMRWMHTTPGVEKNSVSPSPSPTGLEISNMATPLPMDPKDGTSAESSTPATPPA